MIANVARHMGAGSLVRFEGGIGVPDLGRSGRQQVDKYNNQEELTPNAAPFCHMHYHQRHCSI